MSWLESLKAHDKVAKVSQEGTLIIIETKDSRPDLLCLSNFKEKLSGRNLQTLINTHTFNFLICNNKNYYLDEDAINLLSQNNIAYGTGGDVFRLLDSPNTNYSDFISKDSEFIIKNLGNNYNVLEFKITSNRRIVVQRKKGHQITFVFTNEYVLTQARINELYGLYYPFDYILVANPNGRFEQYQYKGQKVLIGLWEDFRSFLANP